MAFSRLMAATSTLYPRHTSLNWTFAQRARMDRARCCRWRRRCAAASGLGGHRVVRHFLPRTVGVVGLHRLDCAVGLLAEVAFEHLAVVADHESHHAGFAVLGGPRDQRVAAAHVVAELVVE